MLINSIPVGSIGTNCYLLGDEGAKVCAVVDPGDDAPAILRLVADSGLAPAMILLTHGHFDHVTAVPGLRAAWPGVPVYIHRADYAESGKPAMYQLPPMENVTFYGEGDAIRLGGIVVEVLHTPGHTPGSVTLKAGDALFTGDTLFRGSMGRTDFDGGSYEAIMKSLKKLGSLPGDYRVCPGHEGASTLDHERKSNYYLREALGA